MRNDQIAWRENGRTVMGDCVGAVQSGDETLIVVRGTSNIFRRISIKDLNAANGHETDHDGNAVVKKARKSRKKKAADPKPALEGGDVEKEDTDAG